MTEDGMGSGTVYSERPGTCIRVLTGGGKLQGRIASKIYALLLAVGDPRYNKRTNYLMSIDIKSIDKEKATLFASVYNKYFERVIWSDHGKANAYLKSLGKMVFKLIDVVANIVNSYCYLPPETLRANLRRRLDPFYVTDDRLEISPHYDQSKANNTISYSFCTVCSGTSCSLNKAMCIQFATVAEMIEKMKQFPVGKKINLSMLDFFRKVECEDFLVEFTDQIQPSEQDSTLSWANANLGWPRKLKEEFDLIDAVVR